jgi:hypothetical protein
VEGGHGSSFGAGRPARRRSRALAAAARQARAKRCERSSNDGGKSAFDSKVLMASTEFVSRVSSLDMVKVTWTGQLHPILLPQLWHK